MKATEGKRVTEQPPYTRTQNNVSC